MAIAALIVTVPLVSTSVFDWVGPTNQYGLTTREQKNVDEFWENERRENAARNAREARERKATARRQTVSETLSEAELDNFAAGMTAMFRAKGLEVLVVADGDTLIVDCTKALYPRETCWEFYKAYPENTAHPEGERLLLRKFGFRSFFYNPAGWRKPL